MSVPARYSPEIKKDNQTTKFAKENDGTINFGRPFLKLYTQKSCKIKDAFWKIEK